jgi:phosphate/sulfate permease
MTHKYPLLSNKNIPAYSAVMGLWIVLSLLIAAGIRSTLGRSIGWTPAIIWSLVSVMVGMGIMFGASAVNLRKWRAGFKRLASGAEEPEIPGVWCPVLTMATQTAVELRRNLKEGR